MPTITPQATVPTAHTIAEAVPFKRQSRRPLLVIGAGPAGLTAALEGVRRGLAVTVLEAGDQVGGLAKTVWRAGYGFDLGGHRFFTKFPRVEQWWRDVLGNDLITVHRQSRIYYRGKFFDYPLRIGNVLKGLGLAESLRILGSYGWAKIHPRKPEHTFDDWVSNRFGRRLFSIFFKSYTEKVWGIPCDQLSADWAAQRIKSLSLGHAVRNALWPHQGKITTLIEEFQYPRRGPGMLWERVRQLVERHGGTVLLNHRVTGVTRHPDGAFTVTAAGPDGPFPLAADAVISSLPLPDLISAALQPSPPPGVRQAARALTYRDLIVVLLVVNRPNLFPDTWIYLHEPNVRASRIQNYGNWSSAMVADPETSCLGIEYHCQRDDDLWRLNDDALVTLATGELHQLGFARAGEVTKSWVVREPRAYPRYTGDYRTHVRTIAGYLQTIPGLITVGRNGTHKYNNQDHSMLTAMLAVENLEGATHDLWSVNADDEYHEIKVVSSK